MDLNQINYEMVIQKFNYKIIKQCLTRMNMIMQNNTYYNNSTKFTKLLSDAKKNIDNVKNNISNLKSLKIMLVNQKSNSENDSSSNLQNLDIENCNKQCYDCLKKSSVMFTKFLFEYIQISSFSDESFLAKNSENKQIVETTAQEEPSYNKSSQNKNIYKNINLKITSLAEETKNNTYNNNTLIISEKAKKVFLPYNIDDLNNVLKTESSYSSLQEIIDEKYTLPLDKYKNPAISRFKETYTLMKKRQKASTADSLDLAIELAFNSSLNPAIITACANLEQLDSYLTCAELNELEKFEYFKIKYEVSPAKKSK